MSSIKAIPQGTTSTTFQYALQVNPIPLTASPAADLDLGPEIASLVLIVTNPSANSVAFTSINLYIPYGGGGGTLTATTPGTPVPANTDFSVTNVGTTTFRGQTVLEYSIGPNGNSLGGNTSWYLEIPTIDVSENFGTVMVSVAETISGNTSDAAFPVVILPYGFFFANLRAYYYNETLKAQQLAVQVPYDTAVTLQWSSSVVPPGDFVVYYTGSQGQTSTKYTDNPVTQLGTWQSQKLTSDTIFTVVASVPSYPAATNALSVAVAVTSPNITASSIEADTIEATGGITITGGGLNATGNVSVSGDLSVTQASYGSDGSKAVEQIYLGASIRFRETVYQDQAVQLALYTDLAGSLVMHEVDTAYNINSLLNLYSGGLRIYDDAVNPAVSVTVEPGGIETVALTVNGNSITVATPHPLSAENLLVHAAVTAPEAAILYRGSARLENGRAVVHLPPWFDSIADPASVTVHLTAIDGFDRLTVLTSGGARVKDNTFVVASDDAASSQAFDWEVKATRSDMSAITVEQAPQPPVKRSPEGRRRRAGLPHRLKTRSES